jgi:hypothetical protein
MNGRIYDPLLGRFLSADLQVQDPKDLQSYNRYSYCRNNPLSRVDPTGFEDKQVSDPFIDMGIDKATDRLQQWGTSPNSGPLHVFRNVAQEAGKRSEVKLEVRIEKGKVQAHVDATIPLDDPKKTSSGVGGGLKTKSLEGEVTNEGQSGNVKIGGLTVGAGRTKDNADGSVSIQVGEHGSMTVQKEVDRVANSSAQPSTSGTVQAGPLSVTLGTTMGVGLSVGPVSATIQTDAQGTADAAAARETGSFAQSEATRKAAEEAARKAAEDEKKRQHQ